MQKKERHAILAELLESGKITSQEDARKELECRGILATQATLSRDFTEMGVVRKVYSDGSIVYSVARAASSYGANLEQVFSQYVLDAKTSLNMIVIITPPGHASVVAAAIDRAEVKGVLGVVAGDDTVFVCCEEDIPAKEVLNFMSGFK